MATRSPNPRMLSRAAPQLPSESSLTESLVMRRRSPMHSHFAACSELSCPWLCTADSDLLSWDTHQDVQYPFAPVNPSCQRDVFATSSQLARTCCMYLTVSTRSQSSSLPGRRSC